MQWACALLSSVACPALQYFSTFSHKRPYFRKKVIEHKRCVLIYLQLYLKHFSLLEEMSEIWEKIYVGLHVKYPLFLSDFNETWIFWTVFRKIFKYEISWKSVHCEPSCSMRTERWIDLTKLIVAFCNFANALNKKEGNRGIQTFSDSTQAYCR